MNPYPERFLSLLAETEGRVLDCGAGGRSHPRVVSLELVPHPNNTVQADAVALPFADGVFDLVLSQAVLEHVADPQRYVDELIRVAAPGALLYIEAAFMQPVHQAPVHFFNATPFGLAYLCRGLDIIDQGTVGSLQDTIAWLCREAGVAAPPIEAPDLSPLQAWNTASGVTLLGRKP